MDVPSKDFVGESERLFTRGLDGFNCDLCKLCYTSEKDLKEHSWSLLHHRKLGEDKGRNAVHECVLCKKDFLGLLAYTKHIHGQAHQDALLHWTRERGCREEISLSETVNGRHHFGSESFISRGSATSFQNPRSKFCGVGLAQKHRFDVQKIFPPAPGVIGRFVPGFGHLDARPPFSHQVPFVPPHASPFNYSRFLHPNDAGMERGQLRINVRAVNKLNNMSKLIRKPNFFGAPTDNMTCSASAELAVVNPDRSLKEQDRNISEKIPVSKGGMLMKGNSTNSAWSNLGNCVDDESVLRSVDKEPLPTQNKLVAVSNELSGPKSFPQQAHSKGKLKVTVERTEESDGDEGARSSGRLHSSDEEELHLLQFVQGCLKTAGPSALPSVLSKSSLPATEKKNVNTVTGSDSLTRCLGGAGACATTASPVSSLHLMSAKATNADGNLQAPLKAGAERDIVAFRHLKKHISSTNAVDMETSCILPSDEVPQGRSDIPWSSEKVPNRRKRKKTRSPTDLQSARGDYGGSLAGARKEASRSSRQGIKQSTASKGRQSGPIAELKSTPVVSSYTPSERETPRNNSSGLIPTAAQSSLGAMDEVSVEGLRECEFKTKGDAKCRGVTNDKFCEYHSRVVGAVKAFIAQKVEVSGSVPTSVNIVSLISDHGSDSFTSRDDGNHLLRKRSLSESQSCTSDSTDVESSEDRGHVDFSRFKRKKHPKVHRGRSNSEDDHEHFELPTSPLKSNMQRNSRFKYLKQLSGSSSSAALSRANLPPTVRKLLEKKRSLATEKEQVVTMPESSYSGSETDPRPVDVPTQKSTCCLSKTDARKERESQACPSASELGEKASSLQTGRTHSVPDCRPRLEEPAPNPLAIDSLATRVSTDLGAIVEPALGEPWLTGCTEVIRDDGRPSTAQDMSYGVCISGTQPVEPSRFDSSSQQHGELLMLEDDSGDVAVKSEVIHDPNSDKLLRLDELQKIERSCMDQLRLFHRDIESLRVQILNLTSTLEKQHNAKSQLQDCLANLRKERKGILDTLPAHVAASSLSRSDPLELQGTFCPDANSTELDEQPISSGSYPALVSKVSTTGSADCSMANAFGSDLSCSKDAFVTALSNLSSGQAASSCNVDSTKAIGDLSSVENEAADGVAGRASRNVSVAASSIRHFNSGSLLGSTTRNAFIQAISRMLLPAESTQVKGVAKRASPTVDVGDSAFHSCTSGMISNCDETRRNCLENVRSLSCSLSADTSVNSSCNFSSASDKALRTTSQLLMESAADVSGHFKLDLETVFGLKKEPLRTVNEGQNCSVPPLTNGSYTSTASTMASRLNELAGRSVVKEVAAKSSNQACGGGDCPSRSEPVLIDTATTLSSLPVRGINAFNLARPPWQSKASAPVLSYPENPVSRSREASPLSETLRLFVDNYHLYRQSCRLRVVLREMDIGAVPSSVKSLKATEKFLFLGTGKPDRSIHIYDRKTNLQLARTLKAFQPVEVLEVVNVGDRDVLYAGGPNGVNGYLVEEWSRLPSFNFGFKVLCMSYGLGVLYVGFINGVIERISPKLNKSSKLLDHARSKGRGIACICTASYDRIEQVFYGTRSGKILACSVNGTLMGRIHRSPSHVPVLAMTVIDGYLFSAAMDGFVRVHDCMSYVDVASFRFFRGVLPANLATVISGAHLYFAVDKIYCANILTGIVQELCPISISGLITSLAVLDSTLFFGSDTGHVHCVQLGEGDEVPSAAIKSRTSRKLSSKLGIRSSYSIGKKHQCRHCGKLFPNWKMRTEHVRSNRCVKARNVSSDKTGS